MKLNLRNITILIFLLSVFWINCTQEASAHATPVLYEPENESVIEKTPEQIKIHYSERVDLEASSIEVFGPDGSRIDRILVFS
jgi:methionine-rich copper-binding protein CopC